MTAELRKKYPYPNVIPLCRLFGRDSDRDSGTPMRDSGTPMRDSGNPMNLSQSLYHARFFF